MVHVDWRLTRHELGVVPVVHLELHISNNTMLFPQEMLLHVLVRKTFGIAKQTFPGCDLLAVLVNGMLLKVGALLLVCETKRLE